MPPNDAGFEEPWQAQIMAIADTLVKTGHVDAETWAKALGNALREAETRDAPDTLETYYTCVLTALEQVTEGVVSPDERQKRRQAWEDAYRHTPHGQPVEL